MTQPDVPHHGPTDATLALRALARFPDRTAFAWDDGEMSYDEAAQLIGGMQAVLLRAGLVSGDCVALLSANRAECWCATIAVQALGCAVSNLHPMGPRGDHAAQIDELVPAVVIVDGQDHAVRAADLARDCPAPQHMTLGGGGPLDLVAQARVLARTSDCSPQDRSRPELAATANFTGGTTGRPKLVLRSAGALAQISLTILADFGLPACPRYLAVAPISHVGGTKIVPVLMRGGTVHLMRGFDPAKVLQVIARDGINMTLMVPTMIYALLDHPDIEAADLSSLELLLYGAAPMAPARLAQGIERIGPVFAQLYGQTECYPIAVLSRGDHDPARPDILAACGHPVSTASVRLIASDGTDAPTGTLGEICVRAPMVMSGFRDRPEETAKALDGGWLHTGDIAVADETGRLTIVDRIKDMIVTGGFNVYPKEIEDVLTEDPAVAMAAVIGVPDDKWGEAVVAYIVAGTGQTPDKTPDKIPDTEALRARVREAKGAVHVPKAFYVVDALPLTGLGKVDKVALRAPHWEGHTRQV
ncbi:AMP-binding protein [Pseudooceanicola nitratireducens]|uniref:AMP-binding protein n=1 Tax=Pseudooceanicola nitratireducens TaxID=517719 RepID=UPI003C7CACE8